MSKHEVDPGWRWPHAHVPRREALAKRLQREEYEDNDYYAALEAQREIDDDLRADQ